MLEPDFGDPQSFDEMSPGELFAFWIYVVFAVICAGTGVWLWDRKIKVMMTTGKS